MKPAMQTRIIFGAAMIVLVVALFYMDFRLGRSGRAEMLGDAALAEAVREGWLTPPLLRGGPPPGGTPVAPLRTLLDELRADRDAR